MHALQAVKVDQMAAGLAVENSHTFTLAAKCGAVVYAQKQSQLEAGFG